MSAFEITSRRVEDEIRVLNDPLYRDERPIVVDFLRRLHQARSPANYFELQRRLVVRARARQELLRDIRGQRQKVGERLTTLAREAPKPLDELRELQRQLDLRHQQERVSEALRFVLLTIGDGMAWRLLRYDRAAITVLGQGTRVARLADDAGFDAEVSEIVRLWQEEGVFALHNDLTTCLRHGDLTVPRADRNRVDIIEVKAGARPEGTPQMRRLELATRLLNEGRASTGDGRQLRVVRLRQPYRTYLVQLRDLVRKVRSTGYGTLNASPCQFVTAIDYAQFAGREHELARVDARTRERLGWIDGPARTFEWFTSMRRMRDRAHSFAGMAPLSVFPLPVEDLADLLLGTLDVRVTLNADLLEAALASKGIEARVAQPPESNATFMTAEVHLGDRILGIGVTPQLREQMLLELMTPASVAAAISGLADALAADPGPDGEEHVVAFADESRVWAG